ncbi:LysM domain-containing protein [Paramyrothecium foliicola]|nr:LysM domain-containing protein [Paramyrothecium foliicola]
MSPRQLPFSKMLTKSIGFAVASLPLSLAAVARQASSASAAAATPAAGDDSVMRLLGPDPELPRAPGSSSLCTWWIDHRGDQFCRSIPDAWAITMEQFLWWNPSISADCGNFPSGFSYCVEAWEDVPGVTTTNPGPTTGASSSQQPIITSTSTTAGNNIPTPEPVQPGIPANCDAFHKVKSGDGCGAIASTYGISLAQLLAWNPEVGSNCQSLWLDFHICVSIVGVEPTKPQPSATSTAPNNGVATPDPIQPGMVGNCDAFHKVKSGDNCAALASTYGVSVSQLTTWNTEIGSNCQLMWLDYHICVSILGVGPSQPPPSATAPGNGISTPEPAQPGMVGNCDAFHKVKSGDTCAALASTYGVTISQLTTWNSQIGSNCQLMWLDYNICVSIVGVGPSRPTSTSTTTAPTNGVATPTPIQPGMVGNCDAFHKVKSGDTCDALSKTYGVTIQQLTTWNTQIGATCGSMWLDYHICVSIIGVNPTMTITTSTTTRSGNGIATPTPIQPGMTTSCTKFHYISPGNTCSQITSFQKITQAQFYKWNPAIGANCNNLQSGTHACVAGP